MKAKCKTKREMEKEFIIMQMGIFHLGQSWHPPPVRGSRLKNTAIRCVKGLNVITEKDSISSYQADVLALKIVLLF